jgi:hypothetical protein
MQLSLRKQAGQIRRPPAAAVRASWMEYLFKPFAMSMAIAAFLGFVGAFGSSVSPFWPRMGLFLFVGVGGSLMVSACVWTTGQIAWLRARPLRRRLSIGLAMTPLSALWIWAVVGYAFTHGPKLVWLPEYLGYSLVMSLAMSLLSWAIFRPRAAGEAVQAASPSKFMERLPFRLRDAELYAVEAEDHYLRVRTAKGSDLILLRLSDALSELQGVEGVQTHRSWWVAKAGVADVKRTEGRAVLLLKDGGEAPVSRTQMKALRGLGWL